MRGQFSIVLILTVLFAGMYFYREVGAVCAVPISYHLGSIDERFDITPDEAKLALAEAEGAWERATQENLFNYVEGEGLPVHFVFDERQAFAEAASEFKDLLDISASRNAEINETYQELIDRYDLLEASHGSRVSSFESRLATYNAEVAEYNEDGGAPAEEFERLEEERRSLDRERASINNLTNDLNELAREINRVSDKGNELINQYNSNVGTFNERFGESHRFTQGDYQGDRINVYKFIDDTELTLVLAHELGHALSLGHVENEASILYDFMGGQSSELMLTSEDIAEFERVCGDDSLRERIAIVFGL